MPHEPPWFVESARELGLDFVHDAGPVDGKYFFPQHQGSGAAFFDFDGDDLLDVLLLNQGGPEGRPNALFRQTADGRFENVSAGSGLDYSAYCLGVATGDVNNDGRIDVAITEYGRTRLFVNRGGGKFVDVSAEAGIDNPLWGASAVFLDYDRDGWLDLAIVNYLDYDRSRECRSPSGVVDFCGPTQFKGCAAKLFRNLGGSATRFRDVSFESGLGKLAGRGLGVLAADFDGDGWPDLFVANDAQANHLWINRRDGTFAEEALIRGAAVNALGNYEANMGIAWGDIDGDGAQDVVVTHLNTELPTLWMQGPRGRFRDRTAESGLGKRANRFTGFGAALADFDNDGWPDLAVTNGHVHKRSPIDSSCDAGDFWRQYAERNQLFRNRSGRFEDISSGNEGPMEFSGSSLVGRGLAVGDLRNDGSLAILVTSVGGSARLYRNTVKGRGHWLGLRVFDPARNRDAIGAEVVVRAGNRKWVQTCQSGGSFFSAQSLMLHVGLGEATAVDGIEVLWPDGKRESFPGGEVDRHRVLSKGTGQPLPP